MTSNGLSVTAAQKLGSIPGTLPGQGFDGRLAVNISRIEGVNACMMYDVIRIGNSSSQRKQGTARMWSSHCWTLSHKLRPYSFASPLRHAESQP